MTVLSVASNVLAAVLAAASLVLLPALSAILRNRRYLSWLRHSYGPVQNIGLLTQGEFVLSKQQIFVERDLRPLPTRDPAPDGGVRLSQVMRRGRVAVVLGGPGSGKTTLVEVMALEIGRRTWSPRGTQIPVVIGLRRHVAKIVQRRTGLGELAAPPHEQGIGPWLERRLRKGRCAVFFDGLDEIVDADDRTRVLSWLRRQVEQYPGNAFVLTSRPDGYLPNPLPHADVFEIQELTAAQTSLFLHRWSYAIESRVAERPNAQELASAQADYLLRRVEVVPALRDLARNPLTLTMMANVHRYRGALPVSAADLYAEVLDVLLYRRQEAKGLVRSTDLPERSKRVAVQELALHMMRNRIRDVPAAKAHDVIRMPIRRVVRPASPGVLLDELVANGLLVESSEGEYSFTSLSMQSYLASAELGEKRVGYLAEQVDDPWWRETILFWAAVHDASLIIEACLNSATARALDLAVEVESVAGRMSPELRDALEREIARRSGWQGAEPAADLTAALAAFVCRTHAERASRLMEAADRENRALTDDDLKVVLAAAPLDVRPPAADAGAYFSAVVMLREFGGEGSARYMVAGLLALAGAMAETSRESARDLYLAALTRVDERSPTDPDFQLALIGHLCMVSSMSWAGDPSAHEVLAEGHRRRGNAVFEELLPVLSETGTARDIVLATLCDDGELSAACAGYLDTSPRQADLRAAWSRKIDQWRKGYRKLLHGRSKLERMEIADAALASTAEQIVALRPYVPPPVRDDLHELARACEVLRGTITDGRSFEKRERAFRSVGRIVEALRAEVRATPTTLTAGVVEPVAARIGRLADEAYRDLLTTHPPKPALSLALEHGTSVDGTVTVQVKVANEQGRAPVESAWLFASPDSGEFAPASTRVDLGGPVPGGASRIALVELTMTETVRDAVSFPLTLVLHHRPRLSERDELVEARLPVLVDGPDEFAGVPNPYRDGALGRPVEDRAMFYGRDELIDRVRTRLREAGSPGAGVVIFGQKRAGKSSIRLHLARRLRDQDGLSVVDVGNIGDLTPGAGDVTGTRLLALLLWRILEGANEAMPDGPPLIPDGLDRAAFLASPDPAYDCAKLINDHRRAAPGRPPLVVLIDEFQYLEQWIRDGLVAASFLRTFKALVERRLFHLVVVGQTELSRLVQADPNVFGVFGTERVTYLTEAHARRLIEDPVTIDTPEARVSRYREHAVDRILELTGCSAFYVQRFCSTLVDYMNARRTALVTEADVDRVSAALLDELEEKDFDNLESPGSADTEGLTFTRARLQAVLLAVARASADGPATPGRVAGGYRGDALKELLDDLVMRDVLRREAGAYRIVVGIYRDWLLKYFGSNAESS